MIGVWLQIAAVPLGAAAAVGVVLWLGCAADRAASAAAGFATAHEPPYARWNDKPGATPHTALDEPEYLDPITITHDHNGGM